jgi:5'-methylthioadenosine phosphorylase
VDIILNTQHQNIKTTKNVIKLAVSRIREERICRCASALETAFVTAPEKIPPEQKKKLKLIIGKYIK